MLILAGVSLNAVIGDNGIITQAQNATYMQGIAALEEYLQTEYVKYYDEANDYTNKIEMLSSKMTNLCLKDGTKNYITYDGKMYYLVNKQSLPDDIKNQLKGGDTTEYIEYIRLIDVYGITEDLRVYYCADGLEGALGTVGDLEVDPSTPLVKVNNDAEMKSALTEALAEIGIEVGEEGITVGDIVSLKDFELDGSKYNITSLSALSELTSLQTLTLKNVNVSNLDGLESCSLLYYIYLKDCKIGDYSKLGTVLDLKYLYIYLSSNINEADANAQITNLGNGLANATNLNELEYFGISGVTDFYEINYSFNFVNAQSKYSYTNNSRSNVTDISALSKFASNIKSSIKYMYLNNNRISSIEALDGFNNIYELDLMCNSPLANLKGLENHTSIVYLTAHACSLIDINGLQGTTGLKYFTVHTNSNLTNLNGLEQSINLDRVLAYSCNITDITALANHTNLKYLSLYSNVNLENVITLGSLTGLNELYLANNEKMIGTEVRDALADPTTHILQNCGGNYSIPSKYNIYFATLTSYDYSNMNLTDDSDEINALKGRTNVTRLNLSGNENLSNEKLQEILSTMTGLKALSLNGCTNLSSIDFIGQGKVTELMELDLRNTNPSLTDLSNLNDYATNLKTLILSNTNTDMSKMQTTINQVSESYTNEINDSWINKNYWTARGLILTGNCSLYSFEGCDNIIKFKNMSSNINNRSGVLDLTGCSNLNSFLDWSNNVTYKLPSSLTSYQGLGGQTDDLSLCNKLTSFKMYDTNQQVVINILSGINEQTKLQKIELNKTGPTDLTWLSLINTSNLTYLALDGNESSYQPSYIKNLSGLENATNLKTLFIDGSMSFTDTSALSSCSSLTSLTISDCPNLERLTGLEGCPNLTTLSATTSKIGVINGLENLTSLTILNLYNNKISNISALSNLKNLTSLSLNSNNISDLSPLENIIENGKIKFTSLNLSNNLLQTTTVSGHNNIDTLTKLYNAGLRSLNISGNNFTPGSTDSLKNLGWTSYTE